MADNKHSITSALTHATKCLPADGADCVCRRHHTESDSFSSRSSSNSSSPRKKLRPRTLLPAHHHGPVFGKTALQKNLSSPTSWLAAKLADSIENVDFEFSWIVLGPSILGQDLCFDTAALAFCQASDYYLRKDSKDAYGQNVLLGAAYSNYGKAIKLLRRKLVKSGHAPSESAAATSSALATFDLILADGAEDKASHNASFAHFESLRLFLTTHPQSPCSKPSILARAFFQDYCRFELFRAHALGSINTAELTFENSYWSGMEPFGLSPLPGCYAALQRASHEMDIRTAALTTYVRDMRNGEPIEPAKITALANLLLEFQDLAAENEALHHQVRIQSTRNEADRKIVAYSFDFGSSHWAKLLHYWGALLTLVRFSLLIDFLVRKQHGATWLKGSQTAELVNTQDRVISNVLMSWQHAYDRSIMARLQVVHPLVITWATLAGKSETSQGIAVDELKSWILTQLRASGVSYLRYCTETTLDDATRIFSIPEHLKCSP